MGTHGRSALRERGLADDWDLELARKLLKGHHDLVALGKARRLAWGSLGQQRVWGVDHDQVDVVARVQPSTARLQVCQ